MNLVEHLQSHAETHPTVYFLAGRRIYPDEIFHDSGFLPLIGRLAEKAARRVFKNEGLSRCGFIYTPAPKALFCEKIDIKPCEVGGLLADSMRLAFLVSASSSVVGMGHEGAVDLTPLYNFFMQIRPEERSAQVDELPETKWPLYQTVETEMAS
jgi:hypothetical protein